MTAVLHHPDVRQHPVLGCIETMTEALASVAGVPVDYLGATEKAAALTGLSGLVDQVGALILRLVANADDVAAQHGARDAGAWLAHHTRTDPGARRRDLLLGEALTRRWLRVGDGLGAGSVNREQAQVIVAALDELPSADLDPEVLVRAEEHLIELAAEFGPRQLRLLGRRILDVVAPEISERHEARALEDEERRARESTSLTLSPAGDGCTRVTAVVPDAVAHRLRTYLEAFTSPRHDAVRGAAVVRGQNPRKRGQAFCAFLESVDPTRMPLHGGDATTVVVTVTLEALRDELAAADLVGATEERVTASEVRRLACTAKIVPAVLGSRSEILDLGRSARLFSAAQRKALRLRDRHCRAEGCSVPAAWCEAHHRQPWSTGGRTDLADGVLLCSFHHHRVHDRRYRFSEGVDGDLRFHRRT